MNHWKERMLLFDIAVKAAASNNVSLLVNFSLSIYWFSCWITKPVWNAIHVYKLPIHKK